MTKFKAGDRVILVADAEEGWAEERGTVDEAEDGYPGMYVVTVDEKYSLGEGDDLIREVHEDDMEPELP